MLKKKNKPKIKEAIKSQGFFFAQGLHTECGCRKQTTSWDKSGAFFSQFLWIMQSLRTAKDSLLSWLDSLWDTCQKKSGTWKLRVGNGFLPANQGDIYSLAKLFLEDMPFNLEICHHHTSSSAEKQTEQRIQKYFSSPQYSFSWLFGILATLLLCNRTVLPEISIRNSYCVLRTEFPRRQGRRKGKSNYLI